MSHTNDGACKKCLEIMYLYPNPDRDLVMWFQDFQSKNPTAHVACMGRGKVDQEAAYHRGASRAHWLSSSHNFNCALDLWVQTDGKYTLPRDWFFNVLKPALPDWIEWLGESKSFPELPHIERKNWHDMVLRGELKPVE